MHKHRSILSLWEIAHRWNDLDPLVGADTPPLMVVDTLELIFQGIADGALTPITGLAGIPAISFEAAAEIASGFLQTHFVDKPMLTGIGVTRQSLGEYCVSNGIKLPSFWFDANDEYEIAAWLAKPEAEKRAELLQPMTPERIAQVFDLPVPEPAGLPLDKLQRTHIDQTVWPSHGQWQTTEPHAHWTHAAGSTTPPKRPPQPG